MVSGGSVYCVLSVTILTMLLLLINISYTYEAVSMCIHNIVHSSPYTTDHTSYTSQPVPGTNQIDNQIPYTIYPAIHIYIHIQIYIYIHCMVHVILYIASGLAFCV